ncbi:hypothetical protein AB6813_15240 [bacterium RCC_150]
MSTTITEAAKDARLGIPAGFRLAAATSEDFADRQNGWVDGDAWVGPKIYSQNLIGGRPETAGVVTWTPDRGLVGVLNPDIYTEADPHGAREAFERLGAMLQYAALEAEATSPSELVKAFRANEDNASNFDEPWTDTRELVLNDCGEPTLNASTVMGGGAPIGVHLTISLEDFEGLGLDVLTESNLLELTGTREEIAAAADIFGQMGAKLKAYLDEQPA